MTYEAWRIQFQSSEQAARAAFEELCAIKTPLTDQQILEVLNDDGDNLLTQYRIDDARAIERAHGIIK